MLPLWLVQNRLLLSIRVMSWTTQELYTWLKQVLDFVPVFPEENVELRGRVSGFRK